MVVMTASLDRFIKKRVIKNILFMTKQSRLDVKKLRSGFQMVKTKWPPNWRPFWRPFCFYHLKAGPDILASLDRFDMKNILFVALFFIKQSRLATIRNPDFFVRVSNGPAIECPGLAYD
jgi:hypothetical protein